MTEKVSAKARATQNVMPFFKQPTALKSFSRVLVFQRRCFPARPLAAAHPRFFASFLN